MPPTLILIYCLLIFLASMAGGGLPSFVKLTHTRLQLAMSLIGGLMLGVALLHLLPHSVVATESLDSTMMAATAGLLTMFFLIRIFHVHPHSPHDETPVPCHHAVPPIEPDSGSDLDNRSGDALESSHPTHDAGKLVSESAPFSPRPNHHQPHAQSHHDHDHHDHDHDLHDHDLHDQNHDHHHHGQVGHQPGRPGVSVAPAETFRGGSHFSWFGLAIGLSIHTLIDGMALAASVAVEAAHGTAGLWGLPAFLAIALHKPLDAMSIATVMSAGGWSRRMMLTVTVLFSLMCPLGALVFLFGMERFFSEHHTVLGMALGFSAGVFLCIALSDLLPEVQFHSHDRVKLSAALLAGVTLAYLISFIEPEHAHSHSPGHRHGHSDESHDSHPPHDHPPGDFHDSHQDHRHSDHSGHSHDHHDH